VKVILLNVSCDIGGAKFGMLMEASRADITCQRGDFQKVVKYAFWLVWSIVVDNLRDDTSSLKAK
jgi:hypothetical protein